MATAQEHYEHHLGTVYTWMGGDLQVALDRNREELRALGLEATAPGQHESRPD